MVEEKRIQIGILFFVALAVLFVVLSAHSQEDVTTVDDSAFEKKMRPPVPFVHDEHNEKAEIEDCSTCHHVYNEGKKVEGESSEGSECSECHAPADGKYPMSLIVAYHKMCKGCHQEKKAGPIMCAECHPRN